MVRFTSLILLVVCSPLMAASVDFTRDVKPIFDAHCISCHGPEKQKSDYRLDSREAALAGGESGEAAIVPGKPETGLLIRVVDGSDKELFMPPRKSDAKPLSAAHARAAAKARNGAQLGCRCSRRPHFSKTS